MQYHGPCMTGNEVYFLKEKWEGPLNKWIWGSSAWGKVNISNRIKHQSQSTTPLNNLAFERIYMKYNRKMY